MSDDLLDNVDIVSLDDVTSSHTCEYCNGICTSTFEGEIEISGLCTGECGDNPYDRDNFNRELNFE